MAICVKRAMRFASRLPTYGSGEKSFTCPAAKICVISDENCSGAEMPLLPATAAEKLSRAVIPMGETAPIPVIKTSIPIILLVCSALTTSPFRRQPRIPAPSRTPRLPSTGTRPCGQHPPPCRSGAWGCSFSARLLPNLSSHRSSRFR
ncbi:hypothetical protein SDC9_177702 [bioreactor metagenome]|uniref:Uncharacterized protein n=1 Tax=bioreactor metagenome TaxID=1076179 RepID=A0A645GWU3_9ZZZZ